MAKKITISFKETKRDTELYIQLMSMEDRSAEIKKILRGNFRYAENTEEDVEKDNDLLQF